MSQEEEFRDEEFHSSTVGSELKRFRDDRYQRESQRNQLKSCDTGSVVGDREELYCAVRNCLDECLHVDEGKCCFTYRNRRIEVLNSKTCFCLLRR